MLTREQVMEAIVAGREDDCIDGRGYQRLAHFFAPGDYAKLGWELRDYVDPETVKPSEWTRENILEQLKNDVEFGFEKALNQRGISASLMHSVVLQWMWVLEDDLANHQEYAQYGLPLFKAVAVKYGFTNPIGEDSGNEGKYAG